MGELKKEEFEQRMRDGGKYIYKVGVLATANENYVNYAYDYITKYALDKTGRNLKGVSKITRNKSYKYKHSSTSNCDTNRGEEIFVLNMINKGTDVNGVFGNIFDYQIPLKNTSEDKGAGKIDFAYILDKKVHIAEIKAEYSKESIMKAIIEIQTYYQILDKEKFFEDFKTTLKSQGVNLDKIEIKKDVVIFNGTKAQKQLSNEKVQELIKLFDINVVVLEKTERFGKVEL